MSDEVCNCGARIGEPHHDLCDHAICLQTGQQRRQCDGNHGQELDLEDEVKTFLDRLDGIVARDAEDRAGTGTAFLSSVVTAATPMRDALTQADCGHEIWTGQSIADRDAASFGWWTRWGPPWIPCEADHPDAVPDTNRLVSEARWNRELQQWDLREPRTTKVVAHLSGDEIPEDTDEPGQDEWWSHQPNNALEVEGVLYETVTDDQGHGTYYLVGPRHYIGATPPWLAAILIRQRRHSRGLAPGQKD